MKPQVFITGVFGFIGSSLYRHLTTRGYSVCGIGRGCHSAEKDLMVTNIRDDEWKSIFNCNDYDVCIHAAGNGLPSKRFLSLSDEYDDTIGPLECVLDWSKDNQKCKHFYFSSSAIYGNRGASLLRESDTPCPISPYGESKRIAEIKCHEESFD